MRVSIGLNFRQSGSVNFQNPAKRILTFDDYFCATELKNISTGNFYNPHKPNIDAISGALYTIQYEKYSLSILQFNVLRAPEMASIFYIWGLFRKKILKYF